MPIDDCNYYHMFSNYEISSISIKIIRKFFYSIYLEISMFFILLYFLFLCILFFSNLLLHDLFILLRVAYLLVYYLCLCYTILKFVPYMNL